MKTGHKSVIIIYPIAKGSLNRLEMFSSLIKLKDNTNSIVDKSVRKGIIIFRGILQRRSTLFVALLSKTTSPNMK